MFGAHIVEQSNDQGLKTVFMSSRTIEFFTPEDELYSTGGQS